MISSHVKISMISLMSSLPLKLYLNSLEYHRNIFRPSSKVFGSLRTSSEIFGKCSGTFVWSSEQLKKIFGIFRKWSEIVGKSSKTAYNKKNITRYLEDTNFMFSWQEQHITLSRRSLVRYCSCHSNIKFISSRHRVSLNHESAEASPASKAKPPGSLELVC